MKLVEHFFFSKSMKQYLTDPCASQVYFYTWLYTKVCSSKLHKWENSG